MCQDLALKYSSAEPEQLLGIIPVEEVAELMRQRIRAQVREEVESDLLDRIAGAEESACEQEGIAEEWRDDAECLFQAIKDALNQDWEEAKITLERAMRNSDAG